MVIHFNKLFCTLKEHSIFRTEIQKIFGIGSNNKINHKFGLTKNCHVGIIKIVSDSLPYNIEHYIVNNHNVSYNLKQEIKDKITKKILMKTYQGIRFRLGLPVHGQRTHSNSQTTKKMLLSNLKKLSIKNYIKKEVSSLKKKKNIKAIKKKK
jgi:small subunit ribosomal protein S13